jgi:hypothetical protein
VNVRAFCGRRMCLLCLSMRVCVCKHTHTHTHAHTRTHTCPYTSVCLRAGANSRVWTLPGASSQTWRWVQPFRTMNTCLESTASVLLNLSSQNEVHAYIAMLTRSLPSFCPSLLGPIPPFLSLAYKDIHTHTHKQRETHTHTYTHTGL